MIEGASHQPAHSLIFMAALTLERVRRTWSLVRQKNSLQIQNTGACPHRKTAYTFSGHALTAIIAISTAQAEPDSCGPMFDALTKMLQTPNHQFMSQSSATDALEHGGKIRTGESISTTDASYVKVNNQWHKVPFTPQDMLKQQEEARRDAKSTCHYVRDDATEGDAKVYESHSETGRGKSDIQIWISKANGLPLREEIDLDLENTGKTHSSVRFDYDHVALPAEIKP